MKILYFGSLNYLLFLETVKLWVSNRSWCFLVVLFVCPQILLLMSKVIQECWTCNPKARLTILRIKKTLNQLLNQPQCKKVKDTNKCWGPRLEGLWHCDWLPAKLPRLRLTKIYWSADKKPAVITDICNILLIF